MKNASFEFHYGVMDSGKSFELLRRHYNDTKNGHYTVLLSPACDWRSGPGMIKSDIGYSQPSISVSPGNDVFEIVSNIRKAGTKIHSVLVDEAQFFTRDQVVQMASIVDSLNIPVIAFGLRADAFATQFEGSKALIELADTLKEIEVECFCGEKAVMNMRFDDHGNRVRSGASVQVGGNDKYRSACRKHWKSVNHIEECNIHKPSEEELAV